MRLQEDLELLKTHQIRSRRAVHWNLPMATLVEHAIRRGEGRLDETGALVVTTGRHTGRAPNDKFIVDESDASFAVWWGDVNRPLDPERFAALHERMLVHLGSRDLYVQDCAAGADPAHQLSVRVVTETAWHSLFARNLFRDLPLSDPTHHTPQFTVLHAPSFRADPQVDDTNSDVFVIVSFAQRLVLIGGTQYAGEIKKSIFTALNYLLPQQDVLTMHCSANADRANPADVALFFGLSGTGKTTLSTDPARQLIGDDEHAWNERGVFNLEGGCYAKAIGLSPTTEPEIYAASQRFGAILENVVFHADGPRIDFDDDSLTENTRAAYPLHFIGNASDEGLGEHPTNIVMLTADAFGVLPPIARLTSEQAIYHFLSGYTAKVAGTEKGVREPQATFSACFGAPFMALHPKVYARLLRERIERHNVNVWLVNTGWSGGPYGVGKRMPLPYTRSMVRAALAGKLADVAYQSDPHFGVAVPQTCPDVPSDVLDPRATWADPAEYDRQATRLLQMFAENYQTFADQPATTTASPGTTVPQL